MAASPASLIPSPVTTETALAATITVTTTVTSAAADLAKRQYTRDLGDIYTAITEFSSDVSTLMSYGRMAMSSAASSNAAERTQALLPNTILLAVLIAVIVASTLSLIITLAVLHSKQNKRHAIEAAGHGPGYGAAHATGIKDEGLATNTYGNVSTQAYGTPARS